MNELALFAGAGGGILGGVLLGWTCIGAVEIEKYPRQVLLARQCDGILPEFPIWDDVCTFDGKPWRGLVDVVSGGFPCQDISCSGKGVGIGGERSGLWAEMHRIICEIRPRFAFMENSPMLTSRGLGRVLGDLAEIGYDACWTWRTAADCGAPHRRERIWILGMDRHANSLHEQAQRGVCRGPIANPCGVRAAEPDMADTDMQRFAESTPCRLQEEHSVLVCRSYASHPDMPGREKQRQQEPAGEEQQASERGGWWSVEPRLGRVADGVSNRVDRLKALGNGQVPIVAATAFRILYRQLTNIEYQP